MEDYQEYRLSQNRSPVTIDKAVSIMKTMITKGFENDKVGGHALKIFQKIETLSKKSDNERDRTFLISEYVGLIDKSPAYIKPVLICAMNTGMRAGEIRKVRWPMFDRYGKCFNLPKEIVKEERPKTVPLNTAMTQLLKTVVRCTHHDFIFTNSERNPYYDKSSFRKPLGKICKDAEIPYGRKEENGCTFHDFRRTVKTNMVEAGVDQRYVDLIFGHTLPGISKRYVKPNLETLHKQMKYYSNWLENEIKNAMSEMESVDQDVDQSVFI